MKFEPGLSLASRAKLADLAQESDRLGVKTFVLSTEGGAGRDAFFDAVRRSLPLDPPVMSSRSWEALLYSLWEGIYSLPENQVVILWEDGDRFKMAAPEEYETALSILADLVRQLADPVATVGEPKSLLVYVSSNLTYRLSIRNWIGRQYSRVRCGAHCKRV